MTLQEAKDFLNKCEKYELRDHAFGDREVTWDLDNGECVGSGYFSGTVQEVYVIGEVFKGQDALQLVSCGKSTVIERNDETGPSEYKEGQTMRGLTLEGVRKELTGE